MEKLTIDRNKWYRGHHEGSSLLRHDGRQCCIGIYCSALGIKDEYLLDAGTADDINKEVFPEEGNWLITLEENSFTKRLVRRGSEISYVMYKINDDDDKISAENRERIIAEKFKENGITVEFIN